MSDPEELRDPKVREAVARVRREVQRVDTLIPREDAQLLLLALEQNRDEWQRVYARALEQTQALEQEAQFNADSWLRADTARNAKLVAATERIDKLGADLIAAHQRIGMLGQELHDAAVVLLAGDSRPEDCPRLADLAQIRMNGLQAWTQECAGERRRGDAWMTDARLLRQALQEARTHLCGIPLLAGDPDDVARDAAVARIDAILAETDTPQSRALHDILVERARQDAKWGVQRHPLPVWLAILMEEVGELAQAGLHQQFGGHAALQVREEAIHVAAVALSIVQALDEARAWSLPKTPTEPS